MQQNAHIRILDMIHVYRRKTRKRDITLLLACAFVLSMLVACGTGSSPMANVEQQVQSSGVTEDTQAASAADTTADTAADAGAASVADAAVENSEDHDDAEDYTWDSSEVIRITLSGNSITAGGDGVTVDGSTATITSAGTYSLTGSLDDGQIIVDTEDEDTVRLILNGASISSSTSAPISIMTAEKAVIILADNTENYVSDSDSYLFEDPEEDEPNAAIFSKSDLTIYGGGALTVTGNYNDGIASKDGLIIAGGNITVNSIDDGIRGKDYLIVKDGQVTVTVQGDGLKSDNDEDTEKGYISIEAGVINVTSGGDAIQASTDVMITGGEFFLSSGGGSSNFVDENTSAKGIKGVVNVNIDGGTFTIDSADDAIHSNGSLVINDGTFAIASGDDGMHADATLEINYGDFRITESYEGIESAVITINDGNFYIVSSDDGINVAGGNDGSGMMNREPGQGGRQGGGRPGQGGGPGQDDFASLGSYYLYINGGYIVIDAAGDGLDSNGSIEMTDGVVIVNGPTENMNGALDYMGSFQITGGFLVAAGSSGMAQAPSESSTQYSLLVNLDTTQRAGTLVRIQTSDGQEILTFAPSKEYQSIVLSSPALAGGSTYEVYYGGSSDGTVSDGLYQGGTYTPGSKYTSFTISSIVTQLGNRRR